MKKHVKSLAVVLILAALARVNGQGIEIPNLINYQGRLVEGTNLYNGPVEMTFRLYDVPTGPGSGGVLCADSSTVAVVDGLYSTYIGDDITWGGLDNALSRTQVWVEVEINGNVLTPRERLVSVGYARYASGVPEGAIRSIHIADNQIYANHIVDGEITESKLDNGSVTGNKIGLGVVGAQHIANGIIDSDKLADNAVSNSELAVNSVTGNKIMDRTITAADVASNTFWQTTGNAGTTPGTHFVGTTDGQPLDLYANNQRILRLDGAYSSPNITGGSVSNVVNPLAAGGTIGGGGGLWGENPNRVTDNYGTIGGGVGNVAGDDAGNVFGAEYVVVGGGAFNRAELSYVTVSGGRSNVARSAGAVIAGGQVNWIADQATNAVIAGGRLNNVGTGAIDTAIGGGFSNLVETGAGGSVIAGGQANEIRQDAFLGSIAGGQRNKIGTNSIYGVVGGGWHNAIGRDGRAAVIVGGEYNEAGAPFVAVGGGHENRVASGSTNAVIAGGWMNSIGENALSATVVGGNENVINRDSSWATISGGNANTIGTNCCYVVISGGAENTVGTNSDASVIAGGGGNSIDDQSTYGAIGGGWHNAIGTNCYGAVIAGGLQNLIYGAADGAFIGGGGGRQTVFEDGSEIWHYKPNRVAATLGVVGGGWGNEIGYQASNSVIVGGSENLIRSNALYASIGGGMGNVIAPFARNAIIPGGLQAQADQYGQLAHAAGSFAEVGDAQAAEYILRRETTSAGSWEELYLDGVSQYLMVTNDKTMTFQALVVARSSSGAESAGYRIEGLLVGGVGGASVAGVTVTTIYEDDALWDATVQGTPGGYNVLLRVKGNGETIRWVANVRTSEVRW